MLKQIRIILLACFFVSTLTAQNQQADSIKKIIAAQKEDTSKVISLVSLSEVLENVSNEDAVNYAKKAIDLAKRINYPSGEIKARLWYARSLANIDQTSEAEKEFNVLSKQIGNNTSKEVLSGYFFGLGSLYEKQKRMEEAIKNYSTCLTIRKELLEEANKEGSKEHVERMKISLGSVYLNLGDACENFSRATEAINYYNLSIGLLKNTKAKKLLSYAYNNLGLAHLNTGNYKVALQNNLEALKIKHELKDAQGIARTYHNIGNVYFNIGDLSAALKNYYLALEKDLVSGDMKNISMLYSNIGVVHEYMGDLDKALESYKLSLEQAQKIDDHANISSCYINMANVLIKQGEILALEKKAEEANAKFNEAFNHQNKALHIYEKEADKQALAVLFLNMGVVNQKLKKFDKARECFLKTVQFSKEGNHMRELSYAYGNLCELDSLTGNYKSAFRNYQQYILLRDSLINEESSKKIVELQMQSDFDKKQTETRLLQEKKDEITRKEIDHQKQQRNLSLIGLAVFALMIVFILRGYKQKQKANKLLEEKNELIASQKHLVEEKNKEITDSINYAQRLQKAILASERTMISAFKESFILYKPKDIVSGDFYWMLHVEDKTVKKDIFVFAAADCTGHGVPGAFMSMLNSTLLNQTTYNPNINTPADALNFLNQELPKNLRSADGTENIQDGMDIAFCLVDLNKKILKYAGANNPCWIVRNKELIELEPLKQAITASTEYEKKKFVDQEITLQTGDSIYVFTDGYADQFGGPKGKKFKYRTLGELLVSINEQSFDKQKEILDQRFMEWKGELEQIDDVLIIGIRI